MTDRVLVAISRYYKHIADELEAGALEALEAALLDLWEMSA